tara:strand:- start:466 stop:714 length:249 start_codon:yes stop_codon:yes gene_type:complete
MKTTYNENQAIEVIKQMHINGMKSALKLRGNYKNLSKEEIRENEFYIKNNLNQYTSDMIFNLEELEKFHKSENYNLTKFLYK